MEYRVPSFLNQDLFQRCENRPPLRWMLIGPQRSGTAMHVDPLLTHAWVTLLQGAKRWCLFPAGTPRSLLGCWVEVHGSFVDQSDCEMNEHLSHGISEKCDNGVNETKRYGRGRRAAVTSCKRNNNSTSTQNDICLAHTKDDRLEKGVFEDAQTDKHASSSNSLPRLNALEWFLKVYPRFYDDAFDIPHKFRPIEILQLPGQTVYVPAGWPHIVLNIGDINLAVTHNFATANGPYG